MYGHPVKSECLTLATLVRVHRSVGLYLPATECPTPSDDDSPVCRWELRHANRLFLSYGTNIRCRVVLGPLRTDSQPVNSLRIHPDWWVFQTDAARIDTRRLYHGNRHPGRLMIPREVSSARWRVVVLNPNILRAGGSAQNLIPSNNQLANGVSVLVELSQAWALTNRHVWG